MADRDATTRKDNLHTGIPFWIKTPNSTVKANRRLSRERFDIIIIGAGITGALMAEALTRADKSVLIVDRRLPVRGSTSASTAMIQHEIDVPLTRLRKKIGEKRADAAWLRSVQAVGDLVNLTLKLNIECKMSFKPALYLAGNELGARALANEATERNKIGIKANYLKRTDLIERFGLDRTAAILSEASASANPAQLAAGLLRAALTRKAQIVSPVEITDMAELSSGVALATRQGEILIAEYAVFCTGYEYLPQMETKSHRITSTWALASKPMSDLPLWMGNMLVWEAADPYLYLRTDESGRIIAGGEDEEAQDSNADPTKLADKAAVIKEKVKKLTGIDIGQPKYVWSSPFGVTKDGLPIIDRVPGYERIFTAMGFGGNGITFAMIASQAITSAITGRTISDLELFSYR
ncbi:FAD-dependent oxidoreductase [Falsochrobactrum shanghaiense]|uniref:FAD-dependent oxidoreductase n=1 Tax=Falsochrobactrum shanghaiense TaxID=2201899 RepID=A0A316JBS2_9HYPH|nr:FAD-dependent oxidoreductase [Falsochrobactrum shanghaiense]PWL16453.1 FAD-dependent oxidoreductase [Falsochrobactrum shanghaiense]